MIDPPQVKVLLNDFPEPLSVTVSKTNKNKQAYL